MASRKAEEMKQKLLRERETLLRQRDALDSEIKGLERAIALVADDEAKPGTGGKKPQVQGIVLGLLEDVGTTGLDATTAVSLADNKGLTIARNSVSSLLSRLKRDGIVEYDGSKYRLKKFTKKDDPGDEFSLRVLHGARQRGNSE